MACSNSEPGADPVAPRLTGAVDGFLSSHRVPGASVAVIHDDVVSVAVAGLADIETAERVTSETAFRTASVMKMYLATIALALVERDQLALDDGVGRFALDLPVGLQDAHRFTVRQLLSHTTGLTQTFTHDEDRGHPLRLRDVLERVPPERACAPGRCWSYADGNYALVEAVIESATGESISTLFERYVVGPLGLRHTRLVTATDVGVRLPPQYALRSPVDAVPAGEEELFEVSLPQSTAVITTAPDAARFVRALFAGELLNSDTVQTMVDTSVMSSLPCLGWISPCQFEYGLGIFRYDLSGREFFGHDGGSGAIVVHEPSHDVAIALLTNGGEQDLGAFFSQVYATIETTQGG